MKDKKLALLVFILIMFIILPFNKIKVMAGDGYNYRTEYRNDNCRSCTDRIVQIGWGETWYDLCRTCVDYDGKQPVKKRVGYFGYYCNTFGTETRTGWDERVYCDTCGAYWLSESSFAVAHPDWGSMGGYTKGALYTHYWCGGHVVKTPITYNVNYDANGGYGNVESQHCTYDTTYTSNSNLFKRDNYHFVGWNTERNGKGLQIQSCEQYKNLTVNDNSTVTLYAQWTASDQFVLYDKNGGEGETYYQSYCAAFNNNFNKNTFSFTGHTFTFWNTKSKGDGGSTYRPNELIPSLSGRTLIKPYVDQNVTLDVDRALQDRGRNLATWTVNNCDAQYFSFEYIKTENGIPYWAIKNSASGKALDVENGICRNGQNVRMWDYNGTDCQLWNLIYKNGYFLIKSKMGNYYLDLAQGKAYNNVQLYEYLGGNSQRWIISDALLHVYARWQENYYNIRYDYGGGIRGSWNPSRAYFDSSFYVSAPSKLGYTFTGWNVAQGLNSNTARYGYNSSLQSLRINSISQKCTNGVYGIVYFKNINPVNGSYVTLKANWKNNKYTIKYDPNGGTGTMDDVDAYYDKAQALPECAFVRSNEGGKSTFLGWSKTQDAKEPDFLDQEEVINLTKKDQDVVTLFAIWDDCPILSAEDMYYTVKDAQNGKITEELLLTTSKAIDDRDLDIQEKVKVRDYDPNEWKQFTTDGSSVVTLTVQDASGNKTKCTFTVHLVDTTSKVIQDSTYVRSINQKFYQANAVQGGLENDSIWRSNPEYVAALKSAMDNRDSLEEETISTSVLGMDYTIKKAGSISRNHTYQTWNFSSADIQAVKNYINENGIGNLKESTALFGFLQEFNYCKK